MTTMQLHHISTALCFIGLALFSQSVFNAAGSSYNAEINGSSGPSPSPAVLPRSNSLPPSPYIGVCYGRLGSNLPVPREVVGFYKQNNIQRMRLYDPDLDVLQALRGSNIEVMLRVSNSDLQYIAVSQDNADTWVKNNVRNYDSIKIMQILAGITRV